MRRPLARGIVVAQEPVPSFLRRDRVAAIRPFFTGHAVRGPRRAYDLIKADGWSKMSGCSQPSENENGPFERPHF